MTSPTPLIENDDLLIRWLPGSGRQLVLAFTGLQHRLGGVPTDESIGTASDGARNHVLIISDLKRTWYSHARLLGKVVEVVKSFIAKHRILHVFAIGNSMGGYGALLFSDRLPLRRVIAFSPQISMHPAQLLETRWIEHRADFGEALPLSLAPSIKRANARFYLFFGAENEADAAQAAQLSQSPSLQLFRLKNCGHDAAKFLKRAGLLKPILADILRGDGAGVAGLLKGRLDHG